MLERTGGRLPHNGFASWEAICDNIAAVIKQEHFFRDDDETAEDYVRSFNNRTLQHFTYVDHQGHTEGVLNYDHPIAWDTIIMKDPQGRSRSSNYNPSNPIAHQISLATDGSMDKPVANITNGTLSEFWITSKAKPVFDLILNIVVGYHTVPPGAQVDLGTGSRSMRVQAGLSTANVGGYKTDRKFLTPTWVVNVADPQNPRDLNWSEVESLPQVKAFLNEQNCIDFSLSDYIREYLEEISERFFRNDSSEIQHLGMFGNDFNVWITGKFKNTVPYEKLVVNKLTTELQKMGKCKFKTFKKLKLPLGQ